MIKASLGYIVYHQSCCGYIASLCLNHPLKEKKKSRDRNELRQKRGKEGEEEHELWGEVRKGQRWYEGNNYLGTLRSRLGFIFLLCQPADLFNKIE